MNGMVLYLAAIEQYVARTSIQTSDPLDPTLQTPNFKSDFLDPTSYDETFQTSNLRSDYHGGSDPNFTEHWQD